MLNESYKIFPTGDIYIFQFSFLIKNYILDKLNGENPIKVAIEKNNEGVIRLNSLDLNASKEIESIDDWKNCSNTNDTFSWYSKTFQLECHNHTIDYMSALVFLIY